jgi:hypothetical protein
LFNLLTQLDGGIQLIDGETTVWVSDFYMQMYNQGKEHLLQHLIKGKLSNQ